MNMTAYSEYIIARQTNANYLRNEFGWKSLFAFDEKTFRPYITQLHVTECEVELTGDMTLEDQHTDCQSPRISTGKIDSGGAL